MRCGGEEKGLGPKDARGQRPGTAAIVGHIAEMFCSIQGEGLCVGERQVFLRMAGCELECSWCDTPASKTRRSEWRIHDGPTPRSRTNPVTVREAVEETLSLLHKHAPVRTVSITGGEPLEQSEFVAEVARLLKHEHVRIYLETSGVEVDGLRRVRPYADVVAMDIKLPSATGTDRWTAHREFLKWLVGKNAFVKIVVDATTPLDEIVHAVHLIAEIDRSFPLVLQPESGAFLKNAKQSDTRATVMRLLNEGQRIALQSLKDVRIIPQLHRVLGVR